MAIHNLTLHLPLQKTLKLGPSIESKASPKDASLWTKDYTENLWLGSPFRQTLTAERISSGEIEIRNLQVDAGFDGSNLIVDKIDMDLLGGSLWGRMTLLPKGEGLSISAALEAVDLDTTLLTKGARQGNAEVSFDARSDLALIPSRTISPEGLLDDVQVQFHLTRIGDQTLDRLITYLDPRGENPSFVQARALMRNKTVASALKNPRVSFSVAHGMLDADIVLPNVKLVDLKIPIRGISVKNILKLSGFRKSLSDLAPMLEASKYLHLQGIDDNENLVFSKGIK
jgi:hypothetical protein